MQRYVYHDDNKNRLSLRNLNLKGGKTIIDLQDNIEDARDEHQLLKGVNECLNVQFKIDRKTDEYVRLIDIDPLGNKRYLKCWY